jgi:toxin FitB
MELWYGFGLKPQIRSGVDLAGAISRTIHETFEGRVLSFSEREAEISGHLLAEQGRKGRMLKVADIQIAAVAMANGLAVATRNFQDFAHDGLAVINPWEA